MKSDVRGLRLESVACGLCLCIHSAHAPYVWMAVLLLSLLWPAAAQAQDEAPAEHRAGLVILHGDGRVVQQCVSFAKETISGYELLQRAGGELSVEAGAMGATVCSIGGEGCSYPAESCFCRCQGSPCVYWSYWRLQEDGRWRYQPLGAGNTRVGDGDVEAWRWAEGTTQSALEPPPLTFEQVCAPDRAQTSTPTPAGQPTSAPVETRTQMASRAEAGDGAQMSALAGATEPARASAPQEEDAPTSLWLLLGGAIVLPAAVLLLWVLVRRGR